MKILLCVLFFCFSATAIRAQTSFNIGGLVKTAAGDTIDAATVFINGSKQVTKTDTKGEFMFNNVSPGTYQLVVNMIGYASVKQNVVIQSQSAKINIILTEKQIVLSEVVIGDGSQRDKQIKVFIKNFLGESSNAKACTIMNTDLLEFSTLQTLLEATTSDFLIIQNKSLGYNIRYLLRNFRFNSGTGITSYDGESLFENIDGTPEQQEQWKLNRRKAYDGSFMHYLRSLYANTTRKEGFLTYNIMNRTAPLQLDPKLVDMEQFLFTVDSNFVELKFKRRFYIYHDMKMASVEDKVTNDKEITQAMDKEGSIMTLFLENAILDKKGSYIDYRSFYIQGYWGKKRLGDQLPFEYQPGD
ncbi:MAG: carboxypeptidase-like regulatory domain-containing protein [Pedobacter sp.]|nr:carboxypeptidase-like regulatory domain-containing protein [Pedobacter sp.]